MNLLARVIAIVGLLGLAGCGYEHPQAKREFPNNWAELCAQTDCERFPVGYMTTQVADGYFYEPVLTRHDRYQAGEPYQYFEVAANGHVLRGALANPERTIFEVGWPCCDRLVERFGIKPPQKMGFATNMGFTYWSTRQWGPSIQAIRREHVKFESLADLEALNLPAFDDNFWLVHGGDLREGPHLARPVREYLLISRKPLIFGRHVWADCATSCDVDTFAFPADPRPDLPQVHISKMGDNRLKDERYCNKPGQLCEPSATPYEAIPEGLKWVEALIVALRTRPADAPAP